MKETALVALAICVGLSIAAVILVLCSRRRKSSSGLDRGLDIGPLFHHLHPPSSPLFSPSSDAAAPRQPCFPSSSVASFPVPFPVAAALVDKHASESTEAGFESAFQDILSSVRASPQVNPADGRFCAWLNVDVSSGPHQRQLLWEAFLGVGSGSSSSNPQHRVTPGLVRLMAKVYKAIVLSNQFFPSPAAGATTPSSSDAATAAAVPVSFSSSASSSSDTAVSSSSSSGGDESAMGVELTDAAFLGLSSSSSSFSSGSPLRTTSANTPSAGTVRFADAPSFSSSSASSRPSAGNVSGLPELVALDVRRCKFPAFRSGIGASRVASVLQAWLTRHPGLQYRQNLSLIAAVVISVFAPPASSPASVSEEERLFREGNFESPVLGRVIVQLSRALIVFERVCDCFLGSLLMSDRDAAPFLVADASQSPDELNIPAVAASNRVLSGAWTRDPFHEAAETRRVTAFLQVLRYFDPQLATFMGDTSLSPELYSIPFLTTLFSDCLTLEDTVGLWDLFLSTWPDGRLALFLSASVLIQLRGKLLGEQFAGDPYRPLRREQLRRGTQSSKIKAERVRQARTAAKNAFAQQKSGAVAANLKRAGSSGSWTIPASLTSGERAISSSSSSNQTASGSAHVAPRIKRRSTASTATPLDSAALLSDSSTASPHLFTGNDEDNTRGRLLAFSATHWTESGMAAATLVALGNSEAEGSAVPVTTTGGRSASMPPLVSGAGIVEVSLMRPSALATLPQQSSSSNNTAPSSTTKLGNRGGSSWWPRTNTSNNSGNKRGSDIDDFSLMVDDNLLCIVNNPSSNALDALDAAPEQVQNRADAPNRRPHSGSVASSTTTATAATSIVSMSGGAIGGGGAPFHPLHSRAPSGLSPTNTSSAGGPAVKAVPSSRSSVFRRTSLRVPVGAAGSGSGMAPESNTSLARGAGSRSSRRRSSAASTTAGATATATASALWNSFFAPRSNPADMATGLVVLSKLLKEGSGLDVDWEAAARHAHRLWSFAPVSLGQLDFWPLSSADERVLTHWERSAKEAAASGAATATISAIASSPEGSSTHGAAAMMKFGSLEVSSFISQALGPTREPSDNITTLAAASSSSCSSVPAAPFTPVSKSRFERTPLTAPTAGGAATNTTTLIVAAPSQTASLSPASDRFLQHAILLPAALASHWSVDGVSGGGISSGGAGFAVNQRLALASLPPLTQLQLSGSGGSLMVSTCSHHTLPRLPVAVVALLTYPPTSETSFASTPNNSGYLSPSALSAINAGAGPVPTPADLIKPCLPGVFLEDPSAAFRGPQAGAAPTNRPSRSRSFGGFLSSNAGSSSSMVVDEQRQLLLAPRSSVGGTDAADLEMALGSGSINFVAAASSRGEASSSAPTSAAPSSSSSLIRDPQGGSFRGQSKQAGNQQPAFVLSLLYGGSPSPRLLPSLVHVISKDFEPSSAAVMLMLASGTSAFPVPVFGISRPLPPPGIAHSNHSNASSSSTSLALDAGGDAASSDPHRRLASALAVRALQARVLCSEVMAESSLADVVDTLLTSPDQLGHLVLTLLRTGLSLNAALLQLTTEALETGVGFAICDLRSVAPGSDPVPNAGAAGGEASAGAEGSGEDGGVLTHARWASSVSTALLSMMTQRVWSVAMAANAVVTGRPAFASTSGQEAAWLLHRCESGLASVKEALFTCLARRLRIFHCPLHSLLKQAVLVAAALSPGNSFNLNGGQPSTFASFSSTPSSSLSWAYAEAFATKMFDGGDAEENNAGNAGDAQRWSIVNPPSPSLASSIAKMASLAETRFAEMSMDLRGITSPFLLWTAVEPKLKAVSSSPDAGSAADGNSAGSNPNQRAKTKGLALPFTERQFIVSKGVAAVSPEPWLSALVKAAPALAYLKGCPLGLYAGPHRSPPVLALVRDLLQRAHVPFVSLLRADVPSPPLPADDGALKACN